MTSCGNPFRMGADAWIALVADRGTWKERYGDVRSHDLLNWKVPKPYQVTLDQLRLVPELHRLTQAAFGDRASVGVVQADPPGGAVVLSIDEKTGIQAKAPVKIQA